MTETTPETQESPQDQPGLSIDDIFVSSQIIDAAVRRGAFGAADAAKVGATYNKLVAFLHGAAPHLFEEKQQEKTANE